MPADTHLLIVEDSHSQREFLLTEARYAIGRDPTCQISVIAQAISKHHATLIQRVSEQGVIGYRIVDGDDHGNPSLNGLWYDLQPIQQRDLESGDQITLAPGANLFYFRFTAGSDFSINHLLASVKTPDLLVTPTTFLLMVKDDDRQRKFILTQDLYTLGRDSKCTIQLVSRFVSKCHATLVRSPQANGADGYRIMDGDAKGRPNGNGLIINGAKSSVWDLESGDEIIFGPRVSAVYYQLTPEYSAVPFDEIGCVQYSSSLGGYTVAPDFQPWIRPDMIGDSDW